MMSEQISADDLAQEGKNQEAQQEAAGSHQEQVAQAFKKKETLDFNAWLGQLKTSNPELNATKAISKMKNEYAMNQINSRARANLSGASGMYAAAKGM